MFYYLQVIDCIYFHKIRKEIYDMFRKIICIERKKANNIQSIFQIQNHFCKKLTTADCYYYCVFFISCFNMQLKVFYAHEIFPTILRPNTHIIYKNKVLYKYRHAVHGHIQYYRLVDFIVVPGSGWSRLARGELSSFMNKSISYILFITRPFQCQVRVEIKTTIAQKVTCRGNYGTCYTCMFYRHGLVTFPQIHIQFSKCVQSTTLQILNIILYIFLCRTSMYCFSTTGLLSPLNSSHTLIKVEM